MLHLCACREGYFWVSSCCVGGEGWCAACGASFVMEKGCKLYTAGKGGSSVRVISDSFCRCVHSFILCSLMPTSEKQKEWNKSYYIYPQDQIFLNAEPCSRVDPKRDIEDNFIHIPAHPRCCNLPVSVLQDTNRSGTRQTKQSCSQWANACRILRKNWDQLYRSVWAGAYRNRGSLKS